MGELHRKCSMDQLRITVSASLCQLKGGGFSSVFFFLEMQVLSAQFTREQFM